MLDNFLKHYGRKGMKWGVRRKRGPDGTVGPSSGKSKPKGATTKTPPKPSSRATAKKKAKGMSNEELKKKIDRLNMEKRYVDLTAPKASSATKKKVKKGNNVVTGILKKAAKQAASDYVAKEFMGQLTKKRPVTPVTRREN